MKKIMNSLAQFKQWILSIVMVRIFLLSNKERQTYLITKNALLFYGYQNIAKRLNECGDVVSSMEISGKSYKYLNRFAMYCDVKEIDQLKRLKLYAT